MEEKTFSTGPTLTRKIVNTSRAWIADAFYFQSKRLVNTSDSKIMRYRMPIHGSKIQKRGLYVVIFPKLLYRTGETNPLEMFFTAVSNVVEPARHRVSEARRIRSAILRQNYNNSSIISPMYEHVIVLKHSLYWLCFREFYNRVKSAIANVKKLLSR